MALRGRCVSLMVLLTLCSLSAVACGRAGASAPALTAAAAKRPFLARGLKFGCPNLAPPTRGGVIQEVGIALRGAATTCEPNLGVLTIYRSASAAKQACGPSAKYFCGQFQYRVRNLVLAIDPRDSITIRSRLLSALRVLGPPTRIA